MSNTVGNLLIEDEASGEGPSRSDVYAALGHDRRHRVLAVLVEVCTPIDVRALARHVAAREAEVSPQSVRDKRVERVHVSLYHNHLPKLADVGLIEYDRQSTVEDVTADVERLSP